MAARLQFAPTTGTSIKLNVCKERLCYFFAAKVITELRLECYRWLQITSAATLSLIILSKSRLLSSAFLRLTYEQPNYWMQKKG